MTQRVMRFSSAGAMSWTFSGSRMVASFLGRWLRQVAELGHQVGVERAFERHDQVRQRRQGRPFPGAELGIIRGDVDLGVGAGKAEGEPFLLLAAEAAAPYQRD